MSHVQVFVTILMAFIIGYVIGRGKNKTVNQNSQKLTPEEWASLQPKEDHAGRNPYDDVHPDVLNALNSNNKIEAIKLFRQYHSASLKEAKHAIDAIFKSFR